MALKNHSAFDPLGDGHLSGHRRIKRTSEENATKHRESVTARKKKTKNIYGKSPRVERRAEKSGIIKKRRKTVLMKINKLQQLQGFWVCLKLRRCVLPAF